MDYNPPVLDNYPPTAHSLFSTVHQKYSSTPLNDPHWCFRPTEFNILLIQPRSKLVHSGVPWIAFLGYGRSIYVRAVSRPPHFGSHRVHKFVLFTSSQSGFVPCNTTPSGISPCTDDACPVNLRGNAIFSSEFIDSPKWS